MRLFVLACTASVAASLVIAPLAHRANVRTRTILAASNAEIAEECIVNAENAAEIAECNGTPVNGNVVVQGPRGVHDPKFSPPMGNIAAIPRDFDECVVDAVGADEIVDCIEEAEALDECLVEAENEMEVSDCMGIEPRIETARAMRGRERRRALDNSAQCKDVAYVGRGPAVVSFEECVVEAEGADQLESCWDGINAREG